MKQDDSHNILDRVRQEQKSNPGFTVPDDYFESFSGRLMHAIKEADTDAFSMDPLLDAAPRVMPYHIPVHYFAKFSVNRVRVVAFKKGLNIAASFILLAVASIFLFTKKPKTTEPASAAPAAAMVNQLTNEQLERFIQTEETIPKDKMVSTRTKKASNADMTTLLKNVPDAELANFLNETAEGTDEIFLN